MILAFLVVVLPLGWAILSSLRPSGEILANPFGFAGFPYWQNFQTAWKEAQFNRYFLNSLVITVGTLVVLIPIGSMAAYVLAQYPFRLSRLLEVLFALGMMFPTILSVIPLYLMLSNWGWVNTLPGIILVYVAYSLSFTIFVLTGFFQGLPRELGEAATIDGAGHSKTFFWVMLPIARPGVVTVACGCAQLPLGVSLCQPGA
ncbi:MAG: carbohydrate ABC transporter permease [Fimbriimonadaceae bacterium]|nr:carbohydrate ABC transporter permease [Fimbriimonadaceae bacterium]